MIGRFTEWFASTGGGQQRFTDVVAISGVASWWWIPVLKDISEIAGYCLPIIGLVWLVARFGVWGLRGGRGHE